jgi:BirA family transcriptional regulator, biotin operon repressor / biotin---[acetyl-CoA-carboxylase] ligase
MQLSLSQKLTPRLEWRTQTGSTNLDLIQLAASENLPHFTVLATANQVAGRGRAGRIWQAPQDSALAISVLLKPNLSPTDNLGSLGWLPLLAGLAMSQTVAELLPDSEVGVKWPNDVLVDQHKICGILTELTTQGGQVSVVVGAGVNITQKQEELPIATATSLAIKGAKLAEGFEERLDQVLASYLEKLLSRYQAFAAAGFSAQASGLRSAVIQNCVTLGRQVRAILPGDQELVGTAVDIDDSGRLILDASGVLTPVAAGEIIHLRH